MTENRKPRRFKRFSVRNVNGTMDLISEARFINLSIGGAAIETEQKLSINKEYTLLLEEFGSSMEVHSKVVWSTMVRFKTNDQGKTVSVYHVGLRFTDTIKDTAFSLLKYISTHHKSEEKRLRGVRFAIKSTNPAVVRSSSTFRVKVISMGGMLIVADQDFKRGELFPMVLKLNSHSCSFQARVTSCFSAGRNRYDIGLAIEEISESDQDVLKQFIDSL